MQVFSARVDYLFYYSCNLLYIKVMSFPGLRQLTEDRHMKKLLLIPILILISCGGSSSDDDNTSSPSDGVISQNACVAVGDNTRRSPRVINGNTCSTANTPVVKLLVLESGGSRVSLCSGTVISNRAIVTAAHCFEGASDVAVESSNSTLTGNSFSVHPNFSINDPDGLFDVAVIVTRENIGVASSPLLIGSNVSSGSLGVLAGFGQDENGNDGVLKAGSTTISSVADLFFETSFDGSGSNSCSGDSGGPFLIERGSEFAVAGIISSGIVPSCGAGDETRYTKVSNSSIMSFIFDNAPGARGV